MRPNHSKNRNGDADSNSQKLHKLLAQSGLGSRRGMEQLIEEGKVSVNGQPATVATRVSPNDTVMVDGKRVNLRFGVSQPRVLLYHKPEGEIVSRDDPEGRASVFDKLPAIHNGRWIAIGRLDINTSGLLLFTNHGELANSLMHPRFQLEREYAVRLLGRLTDDQMDQLDLGVELEDGPARVHSIEDRGGDGANHWYHIVIKEGRNREVRRLFEALGLTVSRLIRVRFGNLEMPPYLKRGQVKELSNDQVREVMQWAGVKGAGGGNGQGRERRHGQQQRQRGDGQPQFGSHQSGFGVMSGGGVPQDQRRGRRPQQGQNQQRRARGGGRPIGPMDMGNEEQRQRPAGGGRGNQQNQQRRGEQRRARGNVPQHVPRGDGQAGASAGNGERRGSRRRRNRGGGREARFDQANKRPQEQGNAQAPESGLAGAAPANERNQPPFVDEFGDRNFNVALPEAASPDPRNATRRPNRRRRKPVTT